MNVFTVTLRPGTPPTLETIARHLGLAKATVSYALRNHPKLPAQTRERVQAAAAELGYRPNPRVASLMAHVRGGRPLDAGERIAFVWVHTPRTAARRDPFLRAVFEGARRRAEQAGLRMEEFFTTDPGMTDQRLGQILHHRGIVGVVLSPVMTSESALTLDWDWSRFACAVIGNVSWTPELHHAGHHHALAMRTVLQELSRGGDRIAAVLEEASNLRAKRAWEAAFLAHHPRPREARRFLRLADPAAAGDLAAWLDRLAPDQLIVSSDAFLEIPGVRQACRRRRIRPAVLYWTESQRGLPGINQRYDRIAEYAVDLVIAQLNNNETGVPDLPRMMLFPGQWVPAG